LRRPGPELSPHAGVAALERFHDRFSIHQQAEALVVVVLPDIEKYLVRPGRHAGEFEVHLVAPHAGANHPSPGRVRGRFQGDLLVFESLAVGGEVFGVLCFPSVAIDGVGGAVEADGAEKFGVLGRERRDGQRQQGERQKQ
jgi:hypothetical protein